jgi:hypothetical protein
MDVKTACKLLNINTHHNLPTLVGLKKKYYAQCLHAHPDKNGNSSESNVQFQQINDAYSFLQTHIQTNANAHYSHYTNQKSKTKSQVPHPDLHTFGKCVGNFIQKTSSIHIDHTVISSIIKSIVDGTYMDDSFSLMGSLNKTTREKIVLFIEIYKNILNLSSDTLELIRIVLLCNDDDDEDDDSTENDSNCENNQIFYLNPTLNDLFDNTIFKLVTNNQLFYVPLWFGESFFDLDCGESLQVICNPILPKGVTIDDDNNLYTSVHIQLSELNKLMHNNCCLSVFIESREICISAIELSNMTFVDNLDSTLIYTYCGKEQGPSRAIPDDMYNIISRSDIFVSVFVK